nr:MAG TPA: single-stranded DNA-binding protein [Caudoviricetes sp.]
MQVSAKRLSDTKDILPVMVSERLIDVTQDYTGEMVEVYGQFRSYNKHDDKHSKLILFVFAREIKFAEEGTYHTNNILLDGFICKPPVYRKTPNGREIADILLAVNRPHGISDYIPCISAPANARYMGTCGTGTHIILQGRIQSREYNKKVGNQVEKKTAYEVSAYWVEDKTV